MSKATTQLAVKGFVTAAGLYKNRFCIFSLHNFTFPPAPKIKLGNIEKASEFPPPHCYFTAGTAGGGFAPMLSEDQLPAVRCAARQT